MENDSVKYGAEGKACAFPRCGCAVEGDCHKQAATAAPDLVNHPPHYTSHPSGIECIQVTEHMGFNLGNAIKYLWRADLKGGLEDLRKAAWYVQREIAKREKSNGK